eukprot:TRINITY_DN375_c0_g2_i3.p1 TRINITY_DN375_c0_g2~~TRINITY_DN375_c0_g2_i3.p1  ORF type:complete len:143 (+),score=25.11 TRINITY_DN375_c0_g2_i3:61-489(+)
MCIRDRFQRVANFLYQNDSNFIVVGKTYPPRPLNQIISNLVGYLSYGIYAIILFGDFIFDQLKLKQPEIYLVIKTHKVASFFLTFFIVGMICGTLTQTGAFEISHEGTQEVLFSKLQTGRMPSEKDLNIIIKKIVDIIEKQK